MPLGFAQEPTDARLDLPKSRDIDLAAPEIGRHSRHSAVVSLREKVGKGLIGGKLRDWAPPCGQLFDVGSCCLHRPSITGDNYLGSAICMKEYCKVCVCLSAAFWDRSYI